MTNTSTFSEEPLSTVKSRRGSIDAVALVVCWAREEPDRVGEVLSIPVEPVDRTWRFGRGDPGPDGLRLFRQRPGLQEPTGPVRSPRISRAQLEMRARSPQELEVTNVGRCPLLHNGEEVARALVRPGDVIELRNEMLLYCRRPGRFPALPEGLAMHPFGGPDAFGLVGESPGMWELRRQVTLLAGQPVHLLIQGASGTGKELVARAIHARSARRGRPILTRNAATFPEGLIDAELFGNMRNYPNPGMPERKGLIGEADGATLFLDEFAELPVALQSHLLRVLDGGEYQRLGETVTRHADLRLIAATNRPDKYLKHDIRARLKARIRVPDLNDRREDIALLVHHLIRRNAAEDRSILRFFPEADPKNEPRIAPALMRALLRHTWTTHVRELEALLLRAILDSPEHFLDLTESVRAELEGAGDGTTSIQLAPGRVAGGEGARGAESRPETAREAPTPASGPAAEPDPLDAWFIDEAPAGGDRAEPGGAVGGAANTASRAGGAQAHGSGARDEGPDGVLRRRLEALGLPDDLSYEALDAICEDLKAAYVVQVLQESDGRLFRAAKRLQCNRDVIRRSVDRFRPK